MSVHQIHVFISHAWAYSEDYETLSSWIFGESWSVGQASLDLRDFSIPKDDPIHDARNNAELAEAIFRQLNRSHVVAIPTGMYATHSRWIQREIAGAKQYSKPILAVIPRGQLRRPEVVIENADEEVGWSKQSVIEGIWNLYRRR